MSWLVCTDAAARDLARLLTRGEEVSEGDLDVALTGRAAVLDLVGAVHEGLTGAGGHGHSPRAGDLDAHPARLMGHLLAQQPRPPGTRALSDALAHPAATATGALWAGVAGHAVVAGHDWAGSNPSSRPTGAQAWTAVTANAALAEAVTLLDPVLAASAAAAGRPLLAEQLTEAAWSGLAGAAGAVREVAGRGLRPPLLDVVPAPSNTLVPVRQLSDLPAAVDRLGHLLATSRSLGPVDVQRVARAMAVTSVHTARLLADTLGYPAPPGRLVVVEGLVEHGGLLARAAARPARTETLFPSNPRPLMQAQVLTRYLGPLDQGAPRAAAGSVTPGRDAAVLLECARSLAAATGQLHLVAQREVAGRRWLVPQWRQNTRNRLDWVTPTGDAPAPPLVTGLAGAARHGAALGGAVAAVVPPLPLHVLQAKRAAEVAHQGMPGVEALGAAVAGHRAGHRAGLRPSTPALPVRPRPVARPERPRQDRDR